VKNTIIIVIASTCILAACAAGFITLSSGLQATDERISKLEETPEPATASPAPTASTKPTTPDVDIDDVIATKVEAAVERVFAQKMADLDAEVASAVTREVEIMTQAFSQTLAAETVAEEQQAEKDRDDRRDRQNQRMAEWQDRRQRSEMTRISTELSLRDDQKDKVATILAGQNDSMRSGMEKMRAGEIDMPSFVQTLRKENDDAMREVLDEEQFTAYQASQEKRYGWLYNLVGRSGSGSAPAASQ
jgi:hypothetical protein